MSEFLFGAGLALLITLLAWSDQLRSLHKDTLEAEKLMSSKRNVDWRLIKSVLKDVSEPNETLKQLKEIFDKSSSKSFENIKIIYHFRFLDRQSRRLKVFYQIKYYLIILLTLGFFIGGIVTFFISEQKFLCLFNTTILFNRIPSIICVLFSVVILLYIVFLYFKEQNYRNNFVNLIDQI